MTLPLFIDQPMCRDRSMCQECRGEDPRYRAAWGSRYTMPDGWPDCPFGLPKGFKANPKPVEPHLLAIAVDLPESEEGKAIMEKVRTRAALTRAVCEKCPDKFLIRIDEETLQVDCQAGYSCGCGGGEGSASTARGMIHLGIGMCKRGHWRGL